MNNGAQFNFELDPIDSFQVELGRATNVILKDPNAMALATVNENLSPSSRVVLYKGLLRGGLSFYTNYDSEKAQSLSKNGKASALFYWNLLDEQIRFEGEVEKLSREENEVYFRSRPRLSQIGAWASIQSQEIPSREYLDQRVMDFEKKYKEQEIPCPPNWGGFILHPLLIEFWFGQSGRLHDRFVFTRESIRQDTWRRFRKSP
jgi:pyridoxamine 5'-phosphate oxidase